MSISNLVNYNYHGNLSSNIEKGKKIQGGGGIFTTDIKGGNKDVFELGCFEKVVDISAGSKHSLFVT